MAFGIYIHIPYCLQRCTYCDFATVGLKQSIPPQDYYRLLCDELQFKKHLAPTRRVSSLYFGGGTPSLVGPEFILGIISQIRNQGFLLEPDLEITMEINPATMDLHQLRQYMSGGVNRFSIGAQTFNEVHLKNTSRLHSVSDTRDTLNLLIGENASFTFDLLFALPQQTLKQLQSDIDQALSYRPQHLSAYCLTVPENHPMAKGRAGDLEQVAMFQALEAQLEEAGLIRYEISNFAQPGFESCHNLVYWTDQPYLGLGMSAHSYLPGLGAWGTRFWNEASLPRYQKQIQLSRVQESFHLNQLPQEQVENLKLHEALTDFSHTSLRLLKGLDLKRAYQKFPGAVVHLLGERLLELKSRGLVQPTAQGYALSQQGRVLTNVVFEALTFLESELGHVDNSPFGLILKGMTW